ncbi:hypothetical protein M758_4G173800 [Ceratodon purpureus]|nr:hypothetical protein M758_4G173800 [Ceratodon purpureus]
MPEDNDDDDDEGDAARWCRGGDFRRSGGWWGTWRMVARIFWGVGSVTPLNKPIEAAEDGVTGCGGVLAFVKSFFFFFFFLGSNGDLDGGRWTRLSGMEVVAVAPEEISDGFVM